MNVLLKALIYWYKAATGESSGPVLCYGLSPKFGN